MFSMMSRSAPRPKLLVTCRKDTPRLAQKAQVSFAVDGDEDRAPNGIDLCDDAREGVREGDASDEVLLLPRPAVDLAFDDFAREDDTFEVEDFEFVIFKLLGGVGGDHISTLPDEIAEVRQGPINHSP